MYTPTSSPGRRSKDCCAARGRGRPVPPFGPHQRQLLNRSKPPSPDRRVACPLIGVSPGTDRHPVFCRPAATPFTLSSSSRRSRSRSACRASSPQAGSDRSAVSAAAADGTARPRTGCAARPRATAPLRFSSSRVVAGDRRARGAVRSYSASTAAGQVVAVAEGEVARGDRPVGLGQAHLRVVEQRREQRPGLVGARARAAPRGSSTAARPLPRPYQPGRLTPGLRPREHPRDRAQVVQPRRSPAAGGREPSRSLLISFSGLTRANHSAKPGGLDQRAVRAQLGRALIWSASGRNRSPPPPARAPPRRASRRAAPRW